MPEPSQRSQAVQPYSAHSRRTLEHLLALIEWYEPKRQPVLHYALSKYESPYRAAAFAGFLVEGDKANKGAGAGLDFESDLTEILALCLRRM